MRSDMTPQQYQRLTVRAMARADQDVREIVKALRRRFPDKLNAIQLRLEPAPSAADVARGVPADAFSARDPVTGELVIYIMPLHDKTGATPGEFRSELRRLLILELCEAIGEDADLLAGD